MNDSDFMKGLFSIYSKEELKNMYLNTLGELNDLKSVHSETILSKDVEIENQHNEITIWKCVFLGLLFLVVISFILGFYIGNKSKKTKDSSRKSHTKKNKIEYL